MLSGLDAMRDADGGQDELGYELWHACAGPLTSMPPLDSLVMYWPQGHIEQVVACTPGSAGAADVRAASKHYDLPSHLLCKISRMELQADPQTDEVFAQMDLTPQSEMLVTKEMREEPPSTRQRNVRIFCKTLTASDTSTHGGFSVPRRSAEDCLPLLDHSMNPPCQELVAKDFHGKEWNFRHIFRGQPRRHLLTTGWSTFVAGKKLVAGDTVIFLCGENGQLRVGVRRASKQQTHTKSTCFSSTNLHLGVLAAATHAAHNSLRFSVIFNPRTSPSEFVIPYHKFLKSEENNLTAGCRFRMKFESEESTERKYAGTIVEVSHVHPVEWPGSKWRSIRVQWDEISTCERHERVSPWEIEPFVPIVPLPPPELRLPKRRPPAIVKETTQPPGCMTSMPVSYEPNKMARIDPTPVDDEDFEMLSSRAPPFKSERSPRTPDPTERWLPRPGVSSYGKISDPYQPSSLLPSPLAAFPALPPGVSPLDLVGKFGIFERSPGHVHPPMRWPTARRVDLSAGVNFPCRDPPPLPNWLCDGARQAGANASSVVSASRPVIERPPANVPSTSFNNEAAAAEMALRAQKQVAFESLWIKPGQSNTAVPSNLAGPSKKGECPPPPPPPPSSPAPEQQCKLFGIDLAEKAPVALNGAASSSHSSDSGHDPSVISLDQRHVSNLAVGPSSQAPARTKVYMMGQFGRTINLKEIESYEGLDRSLAQMFDLDGHPKGYKLIYKDHDNDVLLVGDDPWEEFRNCVKSLTIVDPEAEKSEDCGSQGQV